MKQLFRFLLSWIAFSLFVLAPIKLYDLEIASMFTLDYWQGIASLGIAIAICEHVVFRKGE